MICKIDAVHVSFYTISNKAIDLQVATLPAFINVDQRPKNEMTVLAFFALPIHCLALQAVYTGRSSLQVQPVGATDRRSDRLRRRSPRVNGLLSTWEWWDGNCGNRA